MLQRASIRDQVVRLTAEGNKYLAEASESGSQSSYNKAIQEFTRSYKFALLLNSNDGLKQDCAFNLGVAHIAGGDTARGIALLQTILEHGSSPDNSKKLRESPHKGDIYCQLASGYEKVSDLENAMKCYSHALLQYDHEDDARRVAETYLKMANLFNSQKDFSEARRNFEMAWKVYTKLSDTDNAIVAQTCQIIAGVSDKTFSRVECIRLLDNCRNKCGEHENKEFQGKILCEVGLLYYKVRCLRRAFLCFEKSVGLSGGKHTQRKAVACQNAGAILNELGYYNEAIPRSFESAQLHGKLLNRNAQGQSFCNLGYAHSQNKSYEESWEAYLHALKAFQDTDDHRGQWQCHEGLGALAYGRGEIEKAVEHFNLAISCPTEAIDDGSRQRVLTKLNIALECRQTGEKEQLATENGTGIGRRKSRESDKKLQDSSSDEDVVDSKPSTSKHRRIGKRRMKSLDRGRREYADESDRPVQHIARGISNLTYYSNPFTDDQTILSSGSDSEVADVLPGHKNPTQQPSFMDNEKKHMIALHKEPHKRKKFRGIVQASTMPINALTATRDGDSQISPTANQEASLGQTSGYASRSEVSNGRENVADHERSHLGKIEEDESEEGESSLTSVSDKSSSSSESEEVPDPKKLDANGKPADAPSTAPPTAGQTLDSTHLYATINTKYEEATTSQNEDKCLNSKTHPVTAGQRNRTSIEETEGNPSADDGKGQIESAEPEVQFNLATKGNPPTLISSPPNKKKKMKDKNTHSKACSIM